MKKDLVTDYLNKNSHIVDEKVVVKSCTDNGNFVRVSIEWESDESLQSSTIEISLFDLINFTYSKQ